MKPLLSHISPSPTDHWSAAQACGSGGTTAGLSLGNHLSGMGARMHAYGVCDDPEYFYGFIQGILNDMGATPSVIGVVLPLQENGYVVFAPPVTVLFMTQMTCVRFNPMQQYNSRAQCCHCMVETADMCACCGFLWQERRRVIWSPCTRPRGQAMLSAGRRSWRPSLRSPSPQVGCHQAALLAVFQTRSDS